MPSSCAVFRLIMNLRFVDNFNAGQHSGLF
jgi:hypothetical protein